MAAFSSDAFLKDNAFDSNSFDFGVVVPVPVPVPTFTDGAGIPGAPRRLTYFEEQRLMKVRQEADDMEIVRVLTEFLSRI